MRKMGQDVQESMEEVPKKRFEEVEQRYEEEQKKKNIKKIKKEDSYTLKAANFTQ